jgi:hypothetical protein
MSSSSSSSSTKTKSGKQSKPDKTKSPPSLECTIEEYNDLLSTASSLTEEEAKSELIECARYGEVDSVRALLETWTPKFGDYINNGDKNGNTALHKAGSSGHESTVQLLLHNKADHLQNSSKNTPLHWAAANGHEGIVEMIINHDFGYELDVLLKNEFGRSILTEGFQSQKTKLVGLLLEHDSASEDKLLDGGVEADESKKEKATSGDSSNNDNNKVIDGDFKLNAEGIVTTSDGQSISSSNTSSTGSSGIIHEFDFFRGDESKSEENYCSNKDDETLLMSDQEEKKTLLVRELPIKNADSPFGDSAIDDTTGLGIWSASLVMARWMAQKSVLGRFDNKSVLELGAGCGVPGLTVGLYSRANAVHITDFNPATVQNLKYNIEINANRSSTHSNLQCSEWQERVNASSIDWENEATWPNEKMDFIVGSDLIYQKSIVPLLKKVVSGLLHPDGRFLYTCPSDGRDGLIEFIDTMKNEGFRCTSEEIAPDDYKKNPLSSGDEDDAFLHFYELPVTEYKLYEFRLE